MTLAVTLDRDEDGVWIVECPSIPGCVSQVNTRDEAIENIRHAIKCCLEVRAGRGMPLTVEAVGWDDEHLCAADGREYVLAEVDDFEREVSLVGLNQELMEFLDDRSRSGRTYTIEEARKHLGIDRSE
jgi:predicted RNase H-like HicB family nuclease